MANEFDLDLVARLAAIAEGNANAHAHAVPNEEISGWSQHQMIAASHFVIAASFWSLIDSQRAASLYRRAANFYIEMRHDYSAVLALDAMDMQIVYRVTSAAAERSESPSPPMVAFAMVGASITGADSRGWMSDRLGEHWRHVGNVPVGRLGVPVDLYGDCADAMRAAMDGNKETAFVTRAREYLQRAAEVIRTASHDRYHWNQMQSALLPAEPEAVAMTAAMSFVANRAFGARLQEMIGPLDDDAQLLVRIGDEMRVARFGENEPPRFTFR